MQEIPFILSVPGTIIINGGKITITTAKAKTTVEFQPLQKGDARLFLRKGQNLFDIILRTAQEFVESEGQGARFSAATLYHLAQDKYPNLKRNSWTSHVIASATNHPSYKHYGVKKDYFTYESKGTYRLKPEYQPGNIHDDEDDSSEE